MRRHFRVLDGGMSKEQTQAILNARIAPGETFQSMTIRETNYAFPVMVYHSVLSYRKKWEDILQSSRFIEEFFIS